MGGEIKIVNKNGPGTLMQLCLVLGTSTESAAQHIHAEFASHNLMVSSVLLLDLYSIDSLWIKRIS